MIRRPLLLSAAALSIVLAGCGKKSDSSPTPTPTPTGTPTPTPTPVSYSTLPLTVATEFNASSAATSYTGDLTAGPVTLGAAGTDTQSSRVRLALSTDTTTSTSVFVVHENAEESRYTPTATGITITAPDPSVTEYVFGDTGTAAGQSTRAEFLNNTITGKVTTDTGLALTSVSYATWIRNDSTTGAHRLTSTVWGYNTFFVDMPTTGTATYSARIAGRVIRAAGGVGTLARLGGTATISVDFATGLVNYTLNATTIAGAVETPLGTFTGTGAIGAGNNQFTGSFGGASPVPGTVNGSFFGAAGKEIGITIAGLGTFGGSTRGSSRWRSARRTDRRPAAFPRSVALEPQRDFAHEARIVARREPRRLGGDRAEHVGQVVDLGLGIIAEDIAGDTVLVPGMADADPHAAEIGAEMLIRRAQPVVSRGAAAGLHLDLEGQQVELVVEHGDVGGGASL